METDYQERAVPETQAPNDYEYRKERYAAYVKDRDALRHDSLEVSGRYDKAVLALAGGSLALSITFLEKIARNPASWTLFFLAASWICLIVSLLLELFALSKSQTITNEQMGLLDQEYREFLQTLPEAISIPDQLKQPQLPAAIERLKQNTRLLNLWSKWLLAVGIVFLCTFSLINLPRQPNPFIYPSMSETNKPSNQPTTPIKGGQPLNESKGSYIAPSNTLPPPPPPKPTNPKPTNAPSQVPKK